MHLDGLRLLAIPAPVFRLTELHVLDVSRNALTELPAAIDTFKALTVLDASNNFLTGARSTLCGRGRLLALHSPPMSPTRLHPQSSPSRCST